jgi:5'-3' exonuclease
MVAKMIEDGATHLGVATDHVIESFRNDLWPGYKTGAGIERALWAQFHPLEEALAAMGVAVWPMVELEADDALASAAHLAARDKRVEKVCIWTPDKDLAQCVVGDRVVQIDRRKNEIRDEQAIRVKFGVAPEFIADYLALVGDAADGFPGIAGLGPKTAATLINRHGHIEQFPAGVLSNNVDGPPQENIKQSKSKADKTELSNLARARLFKNLAMLRTDEPLFNNVNELRWNGPTTAFAAMTEKIGDARLITRIMKLQKSART